MKTIRWIAALLMVTTLAGCTATAAKSRKAQADKDVRCIEQPQWTIPDEQGKRIGVFVCFGPDNRLLYAARVLPPEPTLEQKLAAAEAHEKKLDADLENIRKMRAAVEELKEIQEAERAAREAAKEKRKAAASPVRAETLPLAPPAEPQTVIEPPAPAAPVSLPTLGGTAAQ